MEYICNENNQDVEHIVGKDPRNKYHETLTNLSFELLRSHFSVRVHIQVRFWFQGSGFTVQGCARALKRASTVSPVATVERRLQPPREHGTRKHRTGNRPETNREPNQTESNGTRNGT